MASSLPRALVAAILVVAAGCAGPQRSPDDVPGQAAIPRNAHPAAGQAEWERAFGLAFQAGRPQNTDDWFVLAIEADGSEPLVASEVFVPVNGVYGLQWQGEIGTVLEVAPLVRGDAVVEWCLGFFALRAGRLVPVGAREAVDGSYYTGIPKRIGSVHCEVSVERTYGTGITRTTNNLAPSSEPRFFVLQDASFQEFDKLRVVFGARSEHATPFALALRFVPTYPGGAAPAATFEDFLVQREGRAPFLLPALAAGTGFNASLIAATFEIRQNGPGFSVGLLDMRTHGLRPETAAPDLRPAGSVWLLNLRVEPPFRKGWSLVQFDYKSLCASGDWSVSAQLHGFSFANSSAIACEFLGGILLGQPQLLLATGGTGPASSELRLNVANTGTEGFFFQHIAFGTELEELFQLPAGHVAIGNERDLSVPVRGPA